MELTGALATPEDFRNWTPLPDGVERIPYRLDRILLQAPDADLFHSTDAPDAFQSEPPRYLTWSPQIHRAPGPTLS